MSSKSSNNLNSGKGQIKVGGSVKSNLTSDRTTIKHSAVSNPVPGKGGKKSK